MSASPTVRFRALELANAPALYALMRACRTADGEPIETTFEEFVHSTFQLPTAVAERDSIGAVAEGGELVGYGWLFGREGATRAARLWLLGGVHPAHRRHGIGRALLRAGTARAEEILRPHPASVPRHLDVEALPDQAGRIALLESEGFLHVRSFTVMERPIERPIEVAPLEPGLTAVDWRADLDEGARLAHNDAFLDHWGSEPVGPDRWRHLGAAAPGFRADCSSLAIDEDGDVVGYVLSSAPPGMQAERRTAWIGTVGVRWGGRGRGVATALLTRSLAAMQAAGFQLAWLYVDAENPTGAVRVYERLGFREARRQLIYSKSLSPAVTPTPFDRGLGDAHGD
ncbi:MAG: GNAT family N-acetyltransferase [Chloroflexi bacterium]|nr:GNAT family N-acetyltransferase [Chloroflexota bacterium]